MERTPDEQGEIRCTQVLFHLPDAIPNVRGQKTLPLRRPESQEFSPKPVHPSLTSHEVPRLFQKPPQSPYSESSWLAGCVWFRFSDGILLNAHEALFHRHGKLLPRVLLPLRSLDVDTKRWEVFRLGLVAQRRSEIEFELEMTLLRLLLRAGQAQERLGLEVGIFWDPIPLIGSAQTLTIVPLRQLDLLSEAEAQLELLPQGLGKFLARMNVDSAETLEFGCFFAKESRWAFHGFSHSTLLLQSLQGTLHPPLGVNLTGQRHTQLQVNRVEQAGLKLRRSQVQQKEAGDYTVQFHLTKNGEFRLCLDPKEGAARIWNASGFMDWTLKGITEGVGAYFPTEVADGWVARTGVRRTLDLRILRHPGLMAMCFGELASYVLDGKSMDRQALPNLQSVINLIDERGALLVSRPEDRVPFGTGTARLSAWASPRIWDALVSVFVRFEKEFEASEPEVAVDAENHWVFEGFNQIWLRLLRAMIQESALETQGAVFQRSRMGLFNPWVEGLTRDLLVEFKESPGGTTEIYTPTTALLSSSGVLRSFLSLPHHSDGVTIDLNYEGKQHQQLGKEDFLSQIFLNESTDWFELAPKFFIKGKELSLEQARELNQSGMIEMEGVFYQLTNAKSVEALQQFWDQLGGGANALRKGKRKGPNYLRLPRSQALELLSLRAAGIEIQGGPLWKELCAVYDRLGTAEELNLSPITAECLKPYQVLGVSWILQLYKLRLGGILADDMGLGKTLQTLTFLDELRSRGKLGRCLILVPTSLTYTWKTESERFTPDLPMHLFSPKTIQDSRLMLSQDRDQVWIATYGLFTEHSATFKDTPWNVVIFDEAQSLKNLSTKRTTMARALPARFKLCLTGTPLENHLGEFFSLVDLAVPGSLGELSEFRKLYVSPESIDPVALRRLKLKTKPLLLRRSKTQILKELPPKREQVIRIPFEAEQEEIYKSIALSWNQRVRSEVAALGESRSQLTMLTALLRLRQVCSDPSGLPDIVFPNMPPKVSTLMDVLPQVLESGESVLVFTQFISTLKRIQNACIAAGFPVFVINGQTPRSEREVILKTFQESEKGSVLLMTLKTGGVGLNLTRASYVFHIEPWWNPAVENQATDRAHRMGQTRPVQVYRYVMEDSVEEKMELLKLRKSLRFDSLFSQGEEVVAAQAPGSSVLSQADFQFLISRGE